MQPKHGYFFCFCPLLLFPYAVTVSQRLIEEHQRSYKLFRCFTYSNIAVLRRKHILPDEQYSAPQQTAVHLFTLPRWCVPKMQPEILLL